MPTKEDIIITGRSIEEKPETEKFLKGLGLNNNIFYNPTAFHKKTRESSALFKAKLIDRLMKRYDIKLYFEDDPIQAQIIRSETNVKVIDIIQDVWEKENVRHKD